LHEDRDPSKGMMFDRPTRPREMVWFARRQGSLEKDVFDRPTALLWEESLTHDMYLLSLALYPGADDPICEGDGYRNRDTDPPKQRGIKPGAALWNRDFEPVSTASSHGPWVPR